MAKSKSLAQKIAELEDDKAPKEYDPEEDVQDESESGSDEESEDENAGTEHYVSVGKSKLRKPVEVALGPEYTGSKVSRAAFEKDESDGDVSSSDMEKNDEGEENEEEEFIDPEAVDLDVDEEDGDIDSDEALGDSDEEKFKAFAFRGSSKPKVINGVKAKRMAASDFMLDSDEDLEVGNEEVSAGSDEDMEDLSHDDENSDAEEGEEVYDDEEEISNEDDEDDDDDDVEDAGRPVKSSKLDLKAMMSQDQKSVVASISKAATADTEKGIAVKRQRKTFDSLLNIRIRLQKALVATNSMAASDDKGDVKSQPYQAAEEAAIKLFNSLSLMRHQLDKAGGMKTGSKRKREIEPETSNSTIWKSLQESELPAIQLRQEVLEKWSAKVKGAAAPETRKLNTSTPQTIVQVLEDQLADPERLVKRTRTPRSCAPLQAKAKLSEDASIYDDADFYQLLLKELVDQRMVDSASAPSLQANGRPLAQWTAVKEAKTKKNVDTKASKGRKMKFTVHEKLQNFMAPEDRGAWEQDAIDRFFATLLGQRMSLGEEVDADSDEEGGAPLAEEALMLFRS